MIYDTHCHPYLYNENTHNSEKIEVKSEQEILKIFLKSPENRLNSIAVDIDSSLTSIDLAKKYDGISASIWIHPTYTLGYEWNINEALTELENLYHIHREYIVAIGECWLDYYWIPDLAKRYHMSLDEIVEVQKDFFVWQIHLAQELGLPLVIHNRDAWDDVLQILKQQEYTNFVFHCFSWDRAFAKNILEFAPDAKLGIWWVVTFKSADELREVVREIPLKNIVIETDSPYLTPVPYRGKQLNEPAYCQYVMDTIIDIRPESPTQIRETIWENSVAFFSQQN